MILSAGFALGTGSAATPRGDLVLRIDQKLEHSNGTTSKLGLWIERYGVDVWTDHGVEADNRWVGELVADLGYHTPCEMPSYIDASPPTSHFPPCVSFVLTLHRFIDVATTREGLEAIRKPESQLSDSFSVMVEDLAEALGADKARLISSRALATANSSAQFVDTYHTLAEIHQQLRELAREHGGRFVESIATSHEGRSIPIIRFGGSGSSKTFWIQGCIHAREWISPATVM
jgi:hypothetical protein